MSIFDGDLDPLNIPFPTAGGKVFWEDLDHVGDFKLQKNVFTHHCRILNEKNIRVAWGEEGPMRAKLRKLTSGSDGIYPQYGDVIGVHRIGGVYDHYGVYESDECIYEYAAYEGDFGAADIHMTTLKKFIRDSGNCFILTFPEEHGAPGKVGFPVASDAIGMGLAGGVLKSFSEALESLRTNTPYHLYTPEETIQRARSRLKEAEYNLITNNCEHFAIWCKTGIHESHQVDALIRLLQMLPVDQNAVLRNI